MVVENLDWVCAGEFGEGVWLYMFHLHCIYILFLQVLVRMAQNVMISPPPQPQATNQTTASLPLSAVFQRLRQLKAWQHQQQDTLLRQQQEQLVKLRNEQAYQRNQVADTSVGSNERGTSSSPIKVHLLLL